MQPQSTRLLVVSFFLWAPLVVFSILLLSINGFVSAALNFFGILLVVVRLSSNGGDQVNKVLSVMLAVSNLALLIWFIFGKKLLISQMVQSQ